jgi:transcriptional regulator with XRE-family HTH domain
VISGAQLRAARALLGLSAAQLAEAAGVGHRTIQRFEAEDDIPDGRTAILKQIIRTLEAHGIIFLGDPVASPGVQLQRPDPEEPQDT